MSVAGSKEPGAEVLIRAATPSIDRKRDRVESHLEREISSHVQERLEAEALEPVAPLADAFRVHREPRSRCGKAEHQRLVEEGDRDGVVDARQGLARDAAHIGTGKAPRERQRNPCTG